MRSTAFLSCSILCPPFTLIEVDVAIQEIKTIIDQVSQAIELVLIIILCRRRISAYRRCQLERR